MELGVSNEAALGTYIGRYRYGSKKESGCEGGLAGLRHGVEGWVRHKDGLSWVEWV